MFLLSSGFTVPLYREGRALGGNSLIYFSLSAFSFSTARTPTPAIAVNGLAASLNAPPTNGILPSRFVVQSAAFIAGAAVRIAPLFAAPPTYPLIASPQLPTVLF